MVGVWSETWDLFSLMLPFQIFGLEKHFLVHSGHPRGDRERVINAETAGGKEEESPFHPGEQVLAKRKRSKPPPHMHTELCLSGFWSLLCLLRGCKGAPAAPDPAPLAPHPARRPPPLPRAAPGAPCVERLEGPVPGHRTGLGCVVVWTKALAEHRLIVCHFARIPDQHGRLVTFGRGFLPALPGRLSAELWQSLRSRWGAKPE